MMLYDDVNGGIEHKDLDMGTKRTEGAQIFEFETSGILATPFILAKPANILWCEFL